MLIFCSYLIPSATGSLEPGKRRLNWVWYCNYPENSPDLAEIMIDCDNHRHRNTLPVGKMRNDVWNKQKLHAAKVMNPPFFELINKTTQPFVSTVSDTSPDRASFFDNKVLLVGEALALIRPHLALSTNQSAMNALYLEKALRKEMTISQWEQQVLQHAARSQAMTNAFGTYFQYGGWTFVQNILGLKFILGLEALEYCQIPTPRGILHVRQSHQKSRYDTTSNLDCARPQRSITTYFTTAIWRTIPHQRKG